MSRRRVLLSDYTERKRDERGIDVETPDGQVFSIDPPLFWPDNFAEIAASNDNRRIAAAVLGGDDQLAKFEAGGGSATMLVSLISDEMLSGAKPGE